MHEPPLPRVQRLNHSLSPCREIMSTFSTIFSGKWTRNAARNVLITATTCIVFVVLDLLDAILCIFYRILDHFLEVKSSQCYCRYSESGNSNNGESQLSETLYRRKNVFQQMGIFGVMLRKREDDDEKRRSSGRMMGKKNRWSDCGCESCVSWLKNGDHQRLHVVIKDSSPEDGKVEPSENFVFIHGFLSSSSIWTKSVFPNLSEPVKRDYRLSAIDLLGFGRSPKPSDCLYTLRDHLEMIEKSVIHPFQLDSFHLVAHSMGCTIALALASKYSKSVKSITLIAPPYFPPSKDNASLVVLSRLAEKKLWPPMSFWSSLMTWYEQLGCVCFLICRNHVTWEWILKLFTRRRGLHSMIRDLTSHTHHSAWHTMHNVTCGGAKFTDGYLEILRGSGVKINILHGDKDEVVPLECSNNIKVKVPAAKVSTIRDAKHSRVILGRKKNFTQDLERIWVSSTGFTTR